MRVKAVRVPGVLTALLSLSTIVIWNTAAFGAEIHDAAAAGDLARVQALLKSNPELVSSKNGAGVTPLHFAAQKGRRDIAEFLIASKADVNASDNNGDMPLHMAAAFGYADVAAILIANKAEVNAKDEQENATPLH